MDEALQQKAKDVRERAENYFRQGLNCSECVLRSFMDVYDTGLPDEVMTLASGFGGGMGQTRNTCGAITGAMMAVGTVRGRKNPFELEETKDRIKQLQHEIYPPFKALIEDIQGQYGTLICRELSSAYKDDFAGKARKKNCQQMIGHCAELAVKYAEWQPEAKEEQ